LALSRGACHRSFYERADRYLEEVFVPDFNRRFTVRPAQKESAFVNLAGIELELVLSSQHECVVRQRQHRGVPGHGAAAADLPLPNSLRALRGMTPLEQGTRLRMTVLGHAPLRIYASRPNG
jgi:hypothetical protein